MRNELRAGRHYFARNSISWIKFPKGSSLDNRSTDILEIAISSASDAADAGYACKGEIEARATWRSPGMALTTGFTVEHWAETIGFPLYRDELVESLVECA